MAPERLAQITQEADAGSVQTEANIKELVAEVERLRTLVQRLLDAPNYAPLSGVPYAYSAPMDEITCAWCGEWPGRPHEADCPWLEAERLGLTHHVTA